MPYVSTPQKNDSLDNTWGPSHGAKGPLTYHMRLYTAGAPAPDGEGREVTAIECPGYAATLFDHDDIPDSADGVKTITVDMPLSTAEWTVQVDTWVITNGSDPADIRAYGQPRTPLEVTAAGVAPRVVATIFYDPREFLED